jgi:hypothetical protein
MPPLESRLSTHKWPQLYGAIFFQQGFEGFFMETMDEVVGSAKINIFMSYVKVLTRGMRVQHRILGHIGTVARTGIISSDAPIQRW